MGFVGPQYDNFSTPKVDTYQGSPKKEEKEVHMQTSGAETQSVYPPLLPPPSTCHCGPRVSGVGTLEDSCCMIHWFLLHTQAPSTLLEATVWFVALMM